MRRERPVCNPAWDSSFRFYEESKMNAFSKSPSTYSADTSGPELPRRTSEASAPHLLIMEAIAQRLIICVRYNQKMIELAPHFLFSRHEDLFLGAVNLNKNRRNGEEPRLGEYKLAGLSEIGLTTRSFEPLPGFEAATFSPKNKLLFAVD